MDRSGASDDPKEAGERGVPPTSALPPLVPQGQAVEWSVLGSLLSGPLVWGGLGYLLDHLLGTEPILVVLGLLVGSLTSFLIVYRRFGHSD